MVLLRAMTILMLAVAVSCGPAAAQADRQSDAVKAAADKAAAEKAAADKAAADKAAADKAAAEKAAADKAAAERAAKTQRSYLGQFATDMLAGDGRNLLKLPFAESMLVSLPTLEMEWTEPSSGWLKRFCDEERLEKKKDVVEASAKMIDPDNNSKTVVAFDLPSPPCWFPFSQQAKVAIKGVISEAEPARSGEKELFHQSVYVTSLLPPLLITLLVVCLIYPGCALIYWYMRQRNYERAEKKDPAKKPPGFLESLDPVQITANPWGRASLGKLQVFSFTLIVFALLLFHLLRSGVIAAMSADVLALLGISAVGAAGGKIAYGYNRRISFESWAWLIRHNWLPKTPDRDVAPRARWSELFLDSNTKEFDPYGFQMAVFSVVVAVALARTSLSGLGTFKIPQELLWLLGISQTVFIGGKAIDKGGYNELDEKLKEVRTNEHALAGAEKDPNAKPADLTSASTKLIESRAQAAQMFMEIYRNQLQEAFSQEVLDAASQKISSDAPSGSTPPKPSGAG